VDRSPAAIMKGMNAEDIRRQPDHKPPRREQLLAAIIPVPLQRPTPQTPQPLPPLPTTRPPAIEPDNLVLGMARLDRTGRVHDHTVLTALDWHTGQRIDITTVHDTILVHATPTGLHTIGARGEVTLPAAARALCDIPANSRVVPAAVPSENVLLVHPPETVASLLCAHYTTMDDHHAD
jgi:hypothetical protein